MYLISESSSMIMIPEYLVQTVVSAKGGVYLR